MLDILAMIGLALMFLVLLGYVLTYHKGSAWEKFAIGRALMVKSICFLAFIFMVFVAYIDHEPTTAERIVRLVVITSLIGAFSWQWWAMVAEQRDGREREARRKAALARGASEEDVEDTAPGAKF